MNLKRLTDRPDWLRKVTQAVAFSIDATDVQEKLEDLGLHVTVDEIDASRDGGTFTIEGGENETSIVLTLQLTRIEHDFSRIDIGAPMPTASAESRPATPDEHTGPCGYVEDGGCGHRSDCAQHNEPAMPNGPCDCGGLRPPTPEEDAKLVDLAREAPMNGLTIRDIVNAAVARGIAEEVMGDEDDFAAALDAITADAVAAVAKLVEIAINQQGVDAQFGIADWELVELIFQAPVMNMDRPEPEEKSA